METESGPNPNPPASPSGPGLPAPGDASGAPASPPPVVPPGPAGQAMPPGVSAGPARREARPAILIGEKPPAATSARPARKWGWVVLALVVVLVLVLGGGVLLVLLAVAGAARAASGGHGIGLRELAVEGEGPDKIALIEVNGLIHEGSLWGDGPSPAALAVRMLRQAESDPAVKAIVLAVDSPGGTVTGSDLIWNELQSFKKSRKPVVVHMGSLCASGGYYISAPADYIIASPTTVTGSIGVIWPHTDATELFEGKLGLKDRSIKSGPHKDLLSWWRPMTGKEQAIMQEIVDQSYERFVNIVAQGRRGRKGIPLDEPGARDAVKKLADGRIYTAQQADKNGLVDEVEYRERAYAKARELAGLLSASIVSYRRRVGLFEVLAGESESKVNVNHGVQVNFGDLKRDVAPRLHYLWAPEF